MNKRFNVLILIVFLLPFLSACSTIDISGLENFRKETCSVELTANLYPSDDFLSRFHYEKGSYRYIDKDDWQYGDVLAISHLTYTPEIYKKAKEFSLSNLTFCKEHSYECNGYTFTELFCHTVTDEHGVRCNYPKHFNMLAYNDESCTLVFLGYYNGDPNAEEKVLALSDFGSFLETVYSDYFDFGT